MDGFAKKNKTKNNNVEFKRSKYRSFLKQSEKYIKNKNKKRYLAIKKEIEEFDKREKYKKKFTKYRKKGLRYYDDFPKEEAIASHNLFINNLLRQSPRHINIAKKILKFHSISLKKYNLNYNYLNKKISTSEKTYLNLFVNFFSNTIDRTNILFNSYYKLFQKKEYFISMLSLRALLETIYFDIYVTQKLFIYIKEKNIDKFLDLFLKSNFGGRENSIKVISSSLHDKKLRRIIAKYYKKRIHINDAIRYFDIKNFIILIKKYPKIKLNKKHKSYLFFSKIQKSIYRKIKENYFSFGHYQTGYHRLCEIIHPTSIFTHKYDDKENIPDFHWISQRVTHSPFLQMFVFNSILKKEILNQVFLNKDKILEELRKI